MKINFIYLFFIGTLLVACNSNQSANSATSESEAAPKSLTELEQQLQAAVDSLKAEAKENPQEVIPEGVDKLCACYTKVSEFGAKLVQDGLPEDKAQVITLRQEFQNLSKLSSNCQSNLYNAKQLNKVTFVAAKEKCSSTFENIRAAGQLLRAKK